MQSFGLGPIWANTVVFGWPEHPEPDRLEGFFNAVRDVVRLGVNTIVLSSGDRAWEALEALRPKERRIDVWVEPDGHASDLALLGAYLFTRTGDWSASRIRVIGEAADGNVAAATQMLRRRLDEARISAEVKAVRSTDTEIIAEESEGAAIVFLPMRLRIDSHVGPYGSDLVRLVEHLPMTASVLAAQTFDLTAAPDSGAPALLAAAEEQVSRAEARLGTLQRDLAEAEVRLERATEIADATLKPEDRDQEEAAEERVTDLRRRTLSASTRLERARVDVASLIQGREGRPTGML